MRAWIVLLILGLIGWGWLVTHGTFKLDRSPRTHPRSIGPSRQFTPTRTVTTHNGTAVVRYEWATLADSGRHQRLASRFDIDLRRMRQVIDAFGAPQPTATITFRGRTAQEVEAQKRHYFAAMAQRGLIRRQENWMPDYRWIVAQSRGDLQKATQEIIRTARNHGVQSGRETIGALAAFVQYLKYQLQESHRYGPTGIPILICGVHMPLHTLYEGAGDCDSKSALFAALMGNLSGSSVIFLHGNGHLFAGVRSPPRPGDRFVEIKGVPYVLIEATGFWPVGRIPDKLWDSIARNEFEVIKIF